MADIELIATLLDETHRFENDNGDVAVFRGTSEGDRVSLKGPADEDGPGLGRPLRFFGYWSSYTNKRTGIKQKQFCYTSFVPCGSPKGREAIVAYLACVPGVGRIIAARIYEEYGEDSTKVLRETPSVAAAAIATLSEWVAEKASEELKRDAETEELMIEMAGLLKGRGFPGTITQKAIKKWGNKAPRIIQRNPYALMRFHGVGFRRADALYLELGLPPARMKRQALCAAHAIQTASSGDTWHFVEVARKAVSNLIAGAEANPSKAVRLAVRAGLLRRQYTDRDGQPDELGELCWLAPAGRARAEQQVAECVKEMMASPLDWGCDCSEGCSDHQAEMIRLATAGAIGVLGGSPGTGKTYTAAQLVKELLKEVPAESIVICAPTGKAAVRCKVAMSDQGVDSIQSMTIHSLLGVEDAKDGWRFRHGPGNPLEQEYFLIDEASMLDTELFSSFLRALPTTARVLLIGDTNQLLPVGHGAPLRDLIAAGVPYGELTEIRRNSGAIVRACAEIRDGNQFWVEGNLSQSSSLDIASLVNQVAGDFGLNPLREVQVLCAVNERSEKSRRAINDILQAALNQRNRRDRRKFWVGDKVVCTKNGSYKDRKSDNAEVRVANGEMGFIKSVATKSMIVELEAPSREVLVSLGKTGDGETTPWDLAYALSVHKAQGSEFPAAIVCLDSSAGAMRVGDRAWIYTAISRAKQRCILWGDTAVAFKLVEKNRINQRKTFLRELVSQPEAALA